MHRIQRAALIAVCAAIGGFTIPGVAALAGTQASPRATVPAADWTTYHHDRFRTGDGSITGSFTSLHPRFVWHLPTPLPAERNDAMYASPLIDGDVAIVTTLQNRVFAVSTVTGKTLWARTLGAPYAQPGGACGDIGPTIGIVSTPIIDEGRNELFVVGAIGTGPGGHAQSHRLFGLSMTTGKVLYERSVDPPGQQLLFLLQRPALAITKGRVIVGFGGNDGDCGNYHGWVESIAESGTSRIDRYEVAAGSGQGKGAVWMGGAAPTIDKAGNVYVADGNGNATSSHDAYDHSDAVLKLTPSMQLLDWFAPTTWYSDNASDLDLGSGAPQLLGDGLILQVGKTETGYLLNPLHLGHIDGSVRTFSVCAGLGKSNGADALVGNLVVVPCDGGLDAVHVSTTAPYGTTKWTSVSAGSPVYAAGLVWAISGSTGGSTLYALNPSNGNAKLRYNFGAVLNHFATPSVGDNMVFVAAATTLLAFPPG